MATTPDSNSRFEKATETLLDKYDSIAKCVAPWFDKSSIDDLGIFMMDIMHNDYKPPHGKKKIPGLQKAVQDLIRTYGLVEEDLTSNDHDFYDLPQDLRDILTLESLGEMNQLFKTGKRINIRVPGNDKDSTSICPPNHPIYNHFKARGFLNRDSQTGIEYVNEKYYADDKKMLEEIKEDVFQHMSKSSIEINIYRWLEHEGEADAREYITSLKATKDKYEADQHDARLGLKPKPLDLSALIKEALDTSRRYKRENEQSRTQAIERFKKEYESVTGEKFEAVK